ncbi:DNA helicase Pif1-like [Dillenia turbinata]|uniref:DNA helicase Pif1-like n=1 Tax=Dillenia turbinata TaxID=194707 RepID=A0AAN8WGN9_9MAGN
MQMINRCILVAKNKTVDDINHLLIERYPGSLYIYTSVDKTLDGRHQGDFEEFLNSLNPKGLPSHKLQLKCNCLIILLRNLNPTEGPCNEIKLICMELGQDMITHKGKIVFLPKIPLHNLRPGKDGISLKRVQFLVKLCFTMTINKSQGQTLDYVGLYLRESIFLHARTTQTVRVLIIPHTFDEKNDTKTCNVVYKEVFLLA